MVSLPVKYGVAADTTATAIVSDISTAGCLRNILGQRGESEGMNSPPEALRQMCEPGSCLKTVMFYEVTDRGFINRKVPPHIPPPTPFLHSNPLLFNLLQTPLAPSDKTWLGACQIPIRGVESACQDKRMQRETRKGQKGEKRSPLFGEDIIQRFLEGEIRLYLIECVLPFFSQTPVISGGGGRAKTFPFISPFASNRLTANILSV